MEIQDRNICDKVEEKRWARFKGLSWLIAANKNMSEVCNLCYHM